MMTSILMTPDLYDPTLDKEYFIRDLYSTLSNLELNESINSYVLDNSLYKYSNDFNIDRNTFYEHSYSYRFNSRVYGKNLGKSRLLRLVSDMEYNNLVLLLDMVMARNDVDLHDFLEAFSTGF